MNLIAIFFTLTLVVFSDALYSSTSDVIELTNENFDKLVLKSDSVWIVEFYAPWCGHCQSFKSEYEKAAAALKGIVYVGGVDCTKEEQLKNRFGIRGYPTIKIFGKNKNQPTDFTGDRKADAVVNFALSLIKSITEERLGKTKKKSSTTDDVIELTDANFESTVLNSDDMWLVEFYAPWCGHCKNLKPHWDEAASQLKGKVKLGALDATVHTIKANEYDIRGFPTIKYFAAGKKDKNSAEDYNGGRTSSDIVTWANDKVTENVPSPEIIQVNNDEILKEECGKSLCVISVLPNILDCQSSCRNDYLKMLTKLGDKYKKKMWGWLWSAAGVQPELESALDIGGFGYPAMAVVNAKKMKYTLLRGSFSADGINEFLRDLSYGRGSTAPLRGATLPKILETESWDGKDGELPQEEDIDLSDINLGDIKDEL